MTQVRTVRAAAVLMVPDLDKIENSLERVLNSVDNAAAKGAQIVVFPETILPYYPYFSFVMPPAAMGKAHMKLYEDAAKVPGPVTIAIGKKAKEKEIIIVVGVNERDHGSIYNTQIVFDCDGEIILKRRKISPTFHERMIWGQGNASGLRVVKTKIGAIGCLACWEHFNPLARYALMTQHEEIHCSHFPGSLSGSIFSDQIEIAIKHHALESGCFVINATGWLTQEQIYSITTDQHCRQF